MNAVFSPTGKLIGTVCVANQVIAQRDDTHLIAVQTGADQVSSTILEVAAPTR